MPRFWTGISGKKKRGTAAAKDVAFRCLRRRQFCEVQDFLYADFHGTVSFACFLVKLHFRQFFCILNKVHKWRLSGRRTISCPYSCRECVLDMRTIGQEAAAVADSAKKKKTGTKKPGKQGTGTSAKGRAGSGRSGYEEEESGFMRAEVIIICSFAVAVLLFLSNFHLCGTLGEVLRSFQLGVFGALGYIIPPVLFVGTCFHLSNRGNRHAAVKLAAVIAGLLTLCGLLEIFFGGKQEIVSWVDYYTRSSANGAGGGLVGGLLTSFLTIAVGRVGTCLVLLALFILCLVCITERSFVSLLKKGGGKAYQYAREDMDRRREIHAQRVKERREQEEEERQQRVRGVNLNATKLGENSFGDSSGEAEAFDEKEAFSEDFGTDGEEENISSIADSLEGHAGSYGEPVITGLHAETDEEDDFADEPWDAIRLPKDSRTLEELDMAPAAENMAARQDLETAEEETPPWQENVNGPAGPAEDTDTYRTEPAEDGVNYDSIFVAEEPKTVTTASGKVIETETELLQEKIEKKREEHREEAGIPQVEEPPKKEYVFPPLSLLKRGGKGAGGGSESEYRATAMKLAQTLRNFGVGVTVTNISCGPTVTRYELLPEQGVKVSRIVGLSDDIKLSLAATDIRIEAPIPGKSAVGIEVPNKEKNTIHLRDLLESDAFKHHKSSLAFAVGKDIAGQPVVADIAKMPHLLIAGATGSGKSVCINTIIMSLIYKSKPEDVRLIMVDPKVVELSVYNGIPHLLIPVVTDPKKASGALNWAVAEMEDRYKKFARCNVRDLKGYNARIDELPDIEGEEKPGKLPQIVIIIDELADLMMVAPGEVEDAICRLAQLARAAGIHLVIATQRPSVNVITGLIKANVPSRIAFAVSSGTDSRTIIDMNGAEKLLGQGDMLFYPAGMPKPQRVQGAFVSDEEVGRVVNFLTEQGLTADYSKEVASQMASPAAAGGSSAGRDEYFVQAGRFIIEKEKASIGMLQRMFKIGFNRAARIMDQLAEAGVVGEEEGTKPRKILMTAQEFEEMIKNEEG